MQSVPVDQPTQGLRKAKAWGPFRNGPVTLILSWGAFATLALLLWARSGEMVSGLREKWPELVFWVLVIVLLNLLHVDLEPIQFTLDLPFLIAISIVYVPSVAALVAFVASMDVREFRGGVGVARAVYNRSQIGIGVFIASSGYHGLAGDLQQWPDALWGTAVATAVFAAANGAFVSAYVVARGQGTFRGVWRRLHVGKPLEFFLTYFAYGILAYALSRLFLEMGTWSIPLFFAPIVVAYSALVRAERLQAFATRLQKRERLLEMLTSRVEDERRDERLRIASGLHDDVLQALIRMSQLGFFVRETAKPRSQAEQDSNELVTLIQETIETLRSVLGDLQRSPVGRGGLVETLRNLARDVQFESRVKVSLETEPGVRVPSSQELILYQAGREGILNAIKHGAPSLVHVNLSQEGDVLVLTVEDDGRGFDPSDVDEFKHFGLGLVRERLRLAGGSLQVESDAGGTRFTAMVHVDPDEQEAAKRLSDNPSTSTPT
jgi:signal transduction histidine kinase